MTTSTLKITEQSKGDDITTVYAYLIVPEVQPMGRWGQPQSKKCHIFSDFNGTFERANTREYIQKLHDMTNGTLYSHYHIAYDSCN